MEEIVRDEEDNERKRRQAARRSEVTELVIETVRGELMEIRRIGKLKTVNIFFEALISVV